MPEYTVSLLFWIVPGLVSTVALIRAGALSRRQWQLALANIATMAGLGFVLDIWFGTDFFVFPNQAQTLGIQVFGVPIEEYAFYVTGFWAILVLYLYLDHRAHAAVGATDAARSPRGAPALLRVWDIECGFASSFALTCVWLAYEVILDPPFSWPGYILFLTVVAYTPYIVFWRLVGHLVNRRALVGVIVWTVATAITWESLLALPRGYWNYNHEAMLGLFVPGFFGAKLPIEAVSVWFASSLIILTFEWSICASSGFRTTGAAELPCGRA